MATKEEILSTFVSKEGAWFAYKEGIQTGYNEAYYSLRNQAAIAAMQGFITNGFSGDSLPNDHKEARQYLARTCVGVADALIEELKKNNYDTRRTISDTSKG